MLLNATSDLWWKNAIIYCLDVETFLDSNGDGCGDFSGLIQKIDYQHEHFSSSLRLVRKYCAGNP